ncbi:MAG TPA: 3-oxoacyl-[acyl-carrier-protein] synthase III C-terminal domain-containing protein [Gemmatimonadaceae bacterium]|nr:3-oxoacyl-[acyl-carrier-protein] synthase III C-terminal domain-containing protein [Gemmatimonadaceae bacterium]
MTMLARRSRFVAPAAHRAPATLSPVIIGSATALPPHRYRQSELSEIVQAAVPAGMQRDGRLRRFFDSVQVDERYFVVPPERVIHLKGFKERNDLYIEAALELSERVLIDALANAGMAPADIGMLATTSVTGIAVPSLDARLMNRIDLPHSLVRMPLFGLGCLGGAAGVARVSDWLRGNPDQIAVLLSVETCSLAFQLDAQIGNLVSIGLFGDGAAAIVMAGARHPLARSGATAGGGRARVIGARSTFFPATERVMGWDIGDNGFTPVLSANVPTIVRDHAPAAVNALLKKHGVDRDDVAHWVMHPGGPKVIDAMESALDLEAGALEPTRRHLQRVGNLSSASVLFILDEHRRRIAAGERPGGYGVMMAMGPAFCAEVVLLDFDAADVEDDQ